MEKIDYRLLYKHIPIPAQGTPDYYAVDMLNQVLSGGNSSRLNKRVVDEKQLAMYCGALLWPRRSRTNACFCNGKYGKHSRGC